ncbi:hypothetical protein INT47_004618 [Mucor saturninus]|uniref:Uncharacterized protein n=1 Tax=Mucor saturninus TaxID=64648 RepID=A0A8H7RIU2_9FUNG|nr:hypothetical protein INT47_004618 [Mucor saturninus]
MSSAGKIVKHLLAKNGPMTTQSLFAYVPTYQKEFVSKTHLKQKILTSLQGSGVIYKQVKRESATGKPTWEWNFTNQELIEKYKNLTFVPNFSITCSSLH